MEKEKSVKSTFTVICTILFLLAMIIIPPVLRTVMPKKIVVPQEDKIVFLSCSKDSYGELYSIKVEATYVNETSKGTTVTYKQIENLNPTAEKVDNDYYAVVDQLSLFKDLNNVDYVSNSNGSVVVIINSKSVNSNKNEEVLTKYYNNYSTVKNYFESQKYKCKTTNG